MHIKPYLGWQRTPPHRVCSTVAASFAQCMTNQKCCSCSVGWSTPVTMLTRQAHIWPCTASLLGNYQCGTAGQTRINPFATQNWLTALNFIYISQSRTSHFAKPHSLILTIIFPLASAKFRRFARNYILILCICLNGTPNTYKTCKSLNKIVNKYTGLKWKRRKGGGRGAPPGCRLYPVENRRKRISEKMFPNSNIAKRVVMRKFSMAAEKLKVDGRHAGEELCLSPQRTTEPKAFIEVV